ncbi:MAG: ABC-2 family transporter protein [Anaerolineae bacterium]|nr:ABC-2 family transporter protein [Anaerolineae bacterium]
MKIWRLISGYVRHNFMAGMAYRGAFFLQIFGMMINNLMLLFFWNMMFLSFPTLNGWELQDIIVLYSIVAVGFGISVVIFGNASRLAPLITSGELDYYLALPADPLVHLLVSRMSLSGWGDFLFGLLLYLFVLPSAWRNLPLFLLLSLLAGLISTAFAVLTGSLAFWLGESEQLAAQLRMALLNFSLYPVDIFSGGVRLLLYTIIPAAFVGSVPAKLLTDFDIWWLAGLILVTALMGGLASWVFRLGLRRYESGNLVIVRG